MYVVVLWSCRRVEDRFLLDGSDITSFFRIQDSYCYYTIADYSPKGIDTGAYLSLGGGVIIIARRSDAHVRSMTGLLISGIAVRLWSMQRSLTYVQSMDRV